MNGNNVLVLVDGVAKHVYINGVKLAKVRSVELRGMEPAEQPQIEVKLDFDSYKVADREYGMSADEQAREHFAEKGPLLGAMRKFTLAQAHAAGWTDEMLINSGYMKAPEAKSPWGSREAQNRYASGGIVPQCPTVISIREFQTNLPWSIKYSEDFRRNPQSHKDFAHALTHVHKAAGKLSEFVDDMDHRKEVALCTHANREEYTKCIADLVICAMRMANTFPGGVIDLQNAVKDRIESKNGVKL